MDEELLSSSELAKVLGVSKKLFNDWRKRHRDFPKAATKSTRYYLYSRENEKQIRAWMKAKGLPGTKITSP